MSFEGPRAWDVDPIVVIDEINSDPRKVAAMRQMLTKLTEIDHWAITNRMDPWTVRQVWLLHQEVITQAALRSRNVSPSILQEFDEAVIDLARGEARKRYPIQKGRLTGVKCPRCRFEVDALGHCLCGVFEGLR